jgi:hypothetical protein
MDELRLTKDEVGHGIEEAEAEAALANSGFY